MSIDNATRREWDEARKGTEWDQEIDMLASRNQVGGDHYNRRTKIQPIEYILANNIGWCLGNVIKLITRDKENNVQDLLKAKHYIELELEMVHGCDKNGNKLGKYTKEISI